MFVFHYHSWKFNEKKSKESPKRVCVCNCKEREAAAREINEGKKCLYPLCHGIPSTTLASINAFFRRWKLERGALCTHHSMGFVMLIAIVHFIK